MSKATPAHLTYAKIVLRYLIGIKGRKLKCCGKRVSLPNVIGEFFAYVDSNWADDKNNQRSSIFLSITLRFLGVRPFLKL